jgi:hypothetical protein
MAALGINAHRAAKAKPVHLLKIALAPISLSKIRSFTLSPLLLAPGPVGHPAGLPSGGRTDDLEPALNLIKRQ